MCTHANAHSHSVNHLGEMEREWLHLVRLNCMSYEHNRAEGCDRAISHAEMRYGEDNGPLIASRITGIIRAMRAERNGGFGYLSPQCPSCRLKVTEDEWQLILLLQAGYRGHRGDIADAAAEFAGRSDAPVLAAAAARFGSALASTDSRRPLASPSHALH
jgi:hypothetical protein